MPVAIVKASSKDEASPADVQRCVLDRLGRSYALERVLHLSDLGVEEWPKTTSGKVLKRDLKKMTLDLIRQEGEQMNNVTGKTVEEQRGNLRLSEHELQKYLLQRVQTSGILVSTIDDDFHAAGMDSLLAMQLLNVIVKNIDLGTDVPLSPNVIFEAGNIRDLAARLKSVNSQHEDSASSVGEMTAMVERYSRFRPHKPHGSGSPDITIVSYSVVMCSSNLADRCASCLRGRQARWVLIFLHN